MGCQESSGSTLKYISAESRKSDLQARPLPGMIMAKRLSTKRGRRNDKLKGYKLGGPLYQFGKSPEMYSVQQKGSALVGGGLWISFPHSHSHSHPAFGPRPMAYSRQGLLRR